MKLAIQALQEALKTQLKLSEQGTIAEIVPTKGQDKATRGDWESEEAVISYLRKKQFPARVIAEEHGTLNLTKNPQYLFVLDGIDGSGGLVKNPQSRCGTMLSIAENLDPTYDDFIFGGLTEFTTQKIAYAEKFRGAYLIQNQEKTKINSNNLKLSNQSPIHLDSTTFYQHQKGITQGLDEISRLVDETFYKPLTKQGFTNFIGLSSSSSMCLDLLLGNVIAVGGVIAKGVFEPPAEYRLLKEIRGELLAYTNSNWQTMGDKKWSEYGKPLSPLLRTANSQATRELLSQIN